jgi:hypothetical protein
MVGMKLKNRWTGGCRLMCFLTYSEASLMIWRRVNRWAAASMAASDVFGCFPESASKGLDEIDFFGIRVLSLHSFWIPIKRRFF